MPFCRLRQPIFTYCKKKLSHENGRNLKSKALIERRAAWRFRTAFNPIQVRSCIPNDPKAQTIHCITTALRPYVVNPLES